jgi:hypothetical protein
MRDEIKIPFTPHPFLVASGVGKYFIAVEKLVDN